MAQYPYGSRTVVGDAADKSHNLSGRITEIGQAMETLVPEHCADLPIKPVVVKHGYFRNDNRCRPVPYLDI
jgi:hypothetical protein